MDGQMSIFDFKVEEPQEIEDHKEYPCDCCDVAFGSMECFLRKGYIWDKYSGGWLRDHFGKQMRIGMDKRECKYEPKSHNFQCFETVRDGNRIITGKCPYHSSPTSEDCYECDEHTIYWNAIERYKSKGHSITEAIKLTDISFGIKSAYHEGEDDEERPSMDEGDK